MIYRCNYCGAVFSTPDFSQLDNAIPGWGYDLCPECGNNDIETGERCRLCGDGFAADRWCQDCRDDLRERFEDLIREAFTEEEIEALNDIYDGEPFGKGAG